MYHQHPAPREIKQKKLTLTFFRTVCRDLAFPASVLSHLVTTFCLAESLHGVVVLFRFYESASVYVTSKNSPDRFRSDDLQLLTLAHYRKASIVPGVALPIPPRGSLPPASGLLLRTFPGPVSTPVRPREGTSAVKRLRGQESQEIEEAREKSVLPSGDTTEVTPFPCYRGL